ncbi:MAG TPA: hypothetical protein VLM36_04295 [Sphingomicrobium sp.]|nr:hypothetical protein [Sphingomicrobium sp.]
MRGLILLFALGMPGAAIAAGTSALAQVSGGLWEISGAPGATEPVRQCVTDVLLLAQYEHRGKVCARTVLRDEGLSVTISYKCGAAGFGESEIEVLTPRSLRISTQGISDQLPFNYVLQAHRVGECAKSPAVTRH